MILGCRFLTNVADVNTFQYIAQAELYQGDTQNVYFQLTDMSVDRVEQGFSPGGRRYVPPAGTTMIVTLNNIDDALVIQREGVQPFSVDGSIWYVPILGSDGLAGTVTVAVSLTLPGPIPLGFSSSKGVMLRVR
jgi:hypothetical protein